MKQTIIKLLIEEYKQNCFFNELADRGIDLRNAAINIYSLIFDLMGFPANRTEMPEQLLIANPGYNKASIIKYRYSRDYLFDKYNEIFDFQTSEYRVIADDGLGLQFEILEGLADAENKATRFMDWMEKEIKRIPRK